MKIYNFGQTLASHVIYYNGSNAPGTDHACIINVFNKKQKISAQYAIALYSGSSAGYGIRIFYYSKVRVRMGDV